MRKKRSTYDAVVDTVALLVKQPRSVTEILSIQGVDTDGGYRTSVNRLFTGLHGEGIIRICAWKGPRTPVYEWQPAPFQNPDVPKPAPRNA